MSGRLSLVRRFSLLALLVTSPCRGGESHQRTTTPYPGVELRRTKEERKRAGEQYPADPEPILERFKVATDGDLLLLPIDLKGKRYWFALDTGASIGLYDTSFRPMLGDPVKSERIRGPGEYVTVPVFRSLEGKVGKLSLPTDSECFCIDFAKVREIGGQEVYGCLGMDFLRKHVFRIDFDRGELTFLAKVGSNAGERIPIVFQGNDPYVMMEIRGLVGKNRFHVDTGCSGFISGHLREKSFETLNKLGVIRLDSPIHHETWVGKRIERIGYVNSVSLRGFVHDDLIFTESNHDVLGLGYLSRYVITFDFPNSAMYLKKGLRFNRPDARNRSGLVIRRIKGSIQVVSVDKDSPSAKAGILPKDVLLSIDDINSSEISLFSIVRLFCEKNKKYRLLIRRGDKELELRIDLSEKDDR